MEKRDICDGARVVGEDQLGPVIPVIKFADFEDVLHRANNSKYGLGGSIWSADIPRAIELAKKRLECGTAWINQHCVTSPHIPFPTAKESGIGESLDKKVWKNTPLCKSLV